MAIYYFSSMFEEEYINNVFNDPLKISYAANKYNCMLSEGFALNGVDTIVFAALPVTKQNCRKKFIGMKCIKNDNYKVNYYSTVNIPFLKNIIRILQAFFTVLFAPSNTAIIIDIFARSLCIGVYFASKFRNNPYYCLVTDLPEYVGDIGTEIKVGRMMKNVISHSEGYILLTEQMKNRLPCDNKKNVIVEGLVPTESSVIEEATDTDIGDKKIVMYAGSLHKEFGVDRLIDAFLQCYKENEELHLFGNGNYVPVIKEIAEQNKCINYHGVAPNSEIMKYEKNATLLVNPRSSKGEYTKYSFPSKVIEYFSSGTPVLMAKLPGIPSEYYDYCLTFDDNDKDDLKRKIRSALDTESESLKLMGIQAREFVFKQKNNKEQAKKVIEVLLK